MPRFADYPSSTAPNNGDLLVIKDVVSNTTKNITRSNLLVGTALPADTVDAQAIGQNEVTAPKLATDAILLGSSTKTSNQTINGGATADLSSLSTTVTVPAGGRSLQVELYLPQFAATAAAISTVRLWQGSSSGTQLQVRVTKLQDSGDAKGIFMSTPPIVVSAGSVTFVANASSSANNITYTCSATQPAYIAVKLV